MADIRILLVDDDELVRLTLSTLLRRFGFKVDTAAGVTEALKLINEETYEVLLSDLHMPHAGDGLTVVSAMRHANPRTITLLLSAFPEMTAAAEAIRLQADEILVKPVDIHALVAIIRDRLSQVPPPPRLIETVAAILQRTSQRTIASWYSMIERDASVMAVAMEHDVRCAHLPQVFHDLVVRLQSLEPIGTKSLPSVHAKAHGQARRHQGYSAAMMVEESRMLQVSIFQSLQDNLANINFSVLLLSVMTIADEVDSQLSQAMSSYSALSPWPDEELELVH